MFWKFPLGLWFAPKKDGLFIVKFQGRIKYVGIAFTSETGGHIKKTLKTLFKRDNQSPGFMYTNSDLCSVKYLPMQSYDQAKVKMQALKEKYKKHLIKD